MEWFFAAVGADPMIAAVLILWAAAAYRLVLAVRDPAPWRSTIAVALTFLSISATGALVRVPVDHWLGIPNLVNLAGRVALTIALIYGHRYLDALSFPGAPQRRAVTHAGVGAVVIALSVSAWILAPIHDVELPDLAAAPPSPASLVYSITIHLYAAWFIISLISFSARERRRLQVDDPPVAGAVLLITAGCWVGLVTLALFVGRTIFGQVAGRPDPHLDPMTNVLFPVSLLLFGAGVATIPLMRIVIHWVSARQRIDELDSLWRFVRAQHDHLHLPMPGRSTLPFLAPSLVAQRLLIEIADALEERIVNEPLDLDDLARSLAAPVAVHTGQCLTAKDALVALDRAPWPAPVFALSAAYARIGDPTHVQ